MGYSPWGQKEATVCGVAKSQACAESLQSCPSLCDPLDHGLPGSSVHGILQARILEWAAISFCKSDLR